MGTLQPEFRPGFKIVQTLDHDEILVWLRALRLRAYAMGSKYKVASVMAMKRQHDYVLIGGVNVECLDHRHGTHGESSAVSAMVTAFGKKARVDEAWILGSPQHLTGPCADPMADMPSFCCGDCRQHVNEIARHPDIPMHSFSLNGQRITKTLRHLLPDSFSFANIDPALAAVKVLNDGASDYSDAETIGARFVRMEPQNEQSLHGWMSSLESLDYASKLHQAVILHLSNGAYVAGVKVENAAYVGLSAMQGALGNAVALFGTTIIVKGVITLSHSPGDDPALIYPLPVSGLQSLSEFIRDEPENILVTMFTASGQSKTITLADAATLPTTFTKPAYRLDGVSILSSMRKRAS